MRWRNTIRLSLAPRDLEAMMNSLVLRDRASLLTSRAVPVQPVRPIARIIRIMIGKNAPSHNSALPKRGSLEHIWWQECIAKDYSARGYKAIIEKQLNEKSTDIGVMKDNEIVAVEVELSPKNAITNFKDNIDAGFTRTIIACKNNKVKKETKKKLTSFLGQNPNYEEKAKVILLTDFPFVKSLFKEMKQVL